MNESEREEIKNLPLNKDWVNAFSVVKATPNPEFIKELGEMVYRELHARLVECQNKKEYPYETVFLFTIS